MLPKHYKLIAEHAQSYELHDGKDGRSFQISKNGLDRHMHAKIAKMPKYAKGGEVESFKDDKAFVENLVEQNKNNNPISSEEGKNFLVTLPEVSSTSPEITKAEGVAIDTQGENPKSPLQEAPVDPVIKALQQEGYETKLSDERKVYEDYSKAEEQSGVNSANTYANLQNELNNSEIDPLQIYNSYKKRSDSLLKAFQDKEVDPKRFVKNMDTGKKIGTIIGLIFGGLGAGANGENPGITMLNREIERDIEQQKNAQGKAYTLYQLNREALGDETQAALAMREQLTLVAKSEIMQQASLLQGPQAAAKIAPFIHDLDSQIQQIQLRRSLLSAGNSGKLMSTDPTYFLNSISNEKVRAEATKEVADMKQLKILEDALVRAQGLLRESKFSSYLTPGYRDTLMKPLVGRVAKLLEGSMTLNQAEAYEKSFFDSFFNPKSTFQEQQRVLEELFQTAFKDAAFKEGVGVGLDRFAMTHFKEPASPIDRTGPRYSLEQIKEYIRKNINSKDPKTKEAVRFAIEEYGIGK